MSNGEKEEIQHGLVKYIGDLARSSDQMTVALYHLRHFVGISPSTWRLHEVYTRHSSDPKGQVTAQKFHAYANIIIYDKIPLKQKASMRAYMDEIDTSQHCYAVGWTGDHGTPPLTMEWYPQKGCLLSEFAKAFEHKAFIKRFCSLINLDDIYDDDFDWDEDAEKKAKRQDKICEFVWNMIHCH